MTIRWTVGWRWPEGFMAGERYKLSSGLRQRTEFRPDLVDWLLRSTAIIRQMLVQEKSCWVKIQLLVQEKSCWVKIQIVGPRYNLWDQDTICGTKIQFVGPRYNLWDQDTICGTKIQFVG